MVVVSGALIGFVLNLFPGEVSILVVHAVIIRLKRVASWSWEQLVSIVRCNPHTVLLKALFEWVGLKLLVAMIKQYHGGNTRRGFHIFHYAELNPGLQREEQALYPLPTLPLLLDSFGKDVAHIITYVRILFTWNSLTYTFIFCKIISNPDCTDDDGIMTWSELNAT